jgi:PST family polysaccharide transporter
MTAPPLLAFSSIGLWVLPGLFGARWQPVAVIFPFIAVSYLVNAVFNLHSSTLYVLKYNFDVSLFHVAHVFLFATSSWILIRHVGIIGYGWAELIALFGYIAIHWRLERRVGTPQYALALVWVVAASLALFWRELGVWTVAAPVLAFIWPGTVLHLREYGKFIKFGMHRG